MNQGLDRHKSFKSIHHQDCDGTRSTVAAMLVTGHREHWKLQISKLHVNYQVKRGNTNL